MTENFDIIIVGGGPNGLYCYYKLKKIFPKKKIILLEKKNILNNIFSYPNVLWHSLMGELKIPSYLNEAINDLHQPTSIEVAKYYKHFAYEHNLKVLENYEVINIQKQQNNDYNVEAINNSRKINLTSKVIILSTGIYENVNTLSDEINYEYCTHKMDIDNERKNLVLVGDGNSAADFIIYQLPKNKIHWVIKREKWKSIFSNLVGKFDDIIHTYKSNLKIYNNNLVKKIYPERKIELSNGEFIENIDKCYFLIGCNSRNALFEKIGLRYNNSCLDLDDNYQTNLKNIYAFGSIMTKWNNDKKRPNPAYIHNGNPKKLERIIHGIIKNETKEIISKEKICTVNEKQNSTFMINFIKKIKSNIVNNI